jgi:aspergillopepsin I
MSLLFLLICYVLLGEAVANPLGTLAKRGHFSLEQIAVRRKHAWSAPQVMKRTYMKYGIPVPNHIHAALEFAQNGTGQSSVPVRPTEGDEEYLVNVTVGNHLLTLDLDTGSSDL